MQLAEFQKTPLVSQIYFLLLVVLYPSSPTSPIFPLLLNEKNCKIRKIRKLTEWWFFLDEKNTLIGDLNSLFEFFYFFPLLIGVTCYNFFLFPSGFQKKVSCRMTRRRFFFDRLLFMEVEKKIVLFSFCFSCSLRNFCSFYFLFCCLLHFLSDEIILTVWRCLL